MSVCVKSVSVGLCVDVKGKAGRAGVVVHVPPTVNGLHIRSVVGVLRFYGANVAKLLWGASRFTGYGLLHNLSV